jgi:hypothetical protein
MRKKNPPTYARVAQCMQTAEQFTSVRRSRKPKMCNTTSSESRVKKSGTAVAQGVRATHIHMELDTSYARISPNTHTHTRAQTTQNHAEYIATLAWVCRLLLTGGEERGSMDRLAGLVVCSQMHFRPRLAHLGNSRRGRETPVHDRSHQASCFPSNPPPLFNPVIAVSRTCRWGRKDGLRDQLSPGASMVCSGVNSG